MRFKEQFSDSKIYLQLNRPKVIQGQKQNTEISYHQGGEERGKDRREKKEERKKKLNRKNSESQKKQRTENKKENIAKKQIKQREFVQMHQSSQ